METIKPPDLPVQPPNSEANNANIAAQPEGALLNGPAPLALGDLGVRGGDGAELVPFGAGLATPQSVTSPSMLENVPNPAQKTLTATDGPTVVIDPYTQKPTTKTDPGAPKVDD